MELQELLRYPLGENGIRFKVEIYKESFTLTNIDFFMKSAVLCRNEEFLVFTFPIKDLNPILKELPGTVDEFPEEIRDEFSNYWEKQYKEKIEEWRDYAKDEYERQHELSLIGQLPFEIVNLFYKHHYDCELFIR